jgi:hypothetical protein
MTPFTPIGDADFHAFRRDGHLLVKAALGDALRVRLESAVDELYAKASREGGLGPDGSMRTAGVLGDGEFAELLDLPTVFPHIWGHLGWNIVIDHSHVKVDPPSTGQTLARLRDGQGRDARPLLAIDVGYVLGGRAQDGHGATLVIPAGEREVLEITAEPGDAFLLDRRLWHARPDHRSTATRKMIFVGYTYRWIRTRDDAGRGGASTETMSPLRRQLLGHGAEHTSALGITAEPPAGGEDIPLRAELKRRGLLDRPR